MTPTTLTVGVHFANSPLDFTRRNHRGESPLFCRAVCSQAHPVELSVWHAHHQHLCELHSRFLPYLDERAGTGRPSLAYIGRGGILRYIFHVFQLCVRDLRTFRERAILVGRSEFCGYECRVLHRSCARWGAGSKSMKGLRK